MDDHYRNCSDDNVSPAEDKWTNAGKKNLAAWLHMKKLIGAMAMQVTAVLTCEVDQLL